MPGPAPTPRPTLQARGSWRAKIKATHQLEHAAPSCPPFLKGEARAEWRRQVKELSQANVLAKVDRGALAVWCEAWAEFVEATAQLAANGRTYEHGAKVKRKGRALIQIAGTPKASPWVAIRNAAAERLLHVAAQFGFTPAARARLEIETARPVDEDPAEKFFKQSGEFRIGFTGGAAHRIR